MSDVDTELRMTIDGQHVGRSFFTCHPPNHDPDHERGFGWRRQLEARRLDYDIRPPSPPVYPLGVGRECSTPRTCTYCQGPYFNSPDFCDSDNDGVGDEVGTAACYCACSTTDVHAPATMGHYCLGYTRSPSPPPPTGVQGVSMMACRRNLKKEKRARNEACARQFRKAPTGRFRGRGGGPGGAQRAAQENSDNEWLAQIYGQHTIYRRDEGLAAAAPAEEEAKEAVAA